MAERPPVSVARALWESGVGLGFRWAFQLGVGLFVGVLLLELSLRLVPALILRAHQLPTASVAEGDSVILVMGDSVPYGHGLEPDQSWPAQLSARLKERDRADRHIHVHDLALPGGRADSVYTDQLPALAQLDAGVQATVIVQVGHNDYALYGGFQRGPETPRVAIPSIMPWWWNLRVARIVRWWGDAWHEQRFPTSLEEASQQRFVEVVRTIQTETQARGAVLMLATYLIPGEAGRDLDPQDAITINELRRVQLDVNRLLRRSAQELEIPLLDLAWMLPAQPSWDPEMFLDGVHPTAKANAEIAEAVAGRLFPD